MASAEPGRLAFCLEWYDSVAFLKKKFLLFCYPDESIEIFDTKNHRTFLKRDKCPGVVVSNIYVGGFLNIYQRQMEVVGYGDEHTRKIQEVAKQRTFALIKPDVVNKMGIIFEIIEKNCFTISKLKMAQMTQDQALLFYQEHKGQSFLPALVNYVTSGPVIAMELVADNAIARWTQVIGPTDSVVARETAPESLRARFGNDVYRNGFHGSKSPDIARQQVKMFFPSAVEDISSPNSSATLKEGVTCCIIKPHVLMEPGALGEIIVAIQAGKFQINAIQMFQIDMHNADEFLEVYKGVIPSYSEMISELCSGPCIAMEISGFGSETQSEFRKLVGPWDPDIAKRLRPNTLRAKYGKSKAQNVVHCTDLPEDGLMECEFFFCLMQRT